MSDATTVVPNWERSVPRGQPWGNCRVCQHLRRDMSCIAFPERIPIVIASGEVDHLVVRPGQVGDTVFEPLRDKEARRREADRAAALKAKTAGSVAQLQPDRTVV
jgi:hypothetical protein